MLKRLGIVLTLLLGSTATANTHVSPGHMTGSSGSIVEATSYVENGVYTLEVFDIYQGWAIYTFDPVKDEYVDYAGRRLWITWNPAGNDYRWFDPDSAAPPNEMNCGNFGPSE